MSKDLARAIEVAAAAFADHEPPTHEREEGFEGDHLKEADTHLRKACRAIRLARELLEGDRDALVEERYYTAAIELAFACIERTSSAILIATNQISPEDRPPHNELIERSHAAGVWNREDAARLAELYDDNRAVHYYRHGIPSKTKAEAIVAAAVEFHRLATSSNNFDSSACLCTTGKQ